jgi:hypothetical protein
MTQYEPFDPRDDERYRRVADDLHGILQAAKKHPNLNAPDVQQVATEIYWHLSLIGTAPGSYEAARALLVRLGKMLLGEERARKLLVR